MAFVLTNPPPPRDASTRSATSTRSRPTSRMRKLLEPKPENGRPQPLRAHHLPLPRRRSQAALPRHRLSSATRSASPAKVAHIEYDPNRTARIALLHYVDGDKRYILAPDGLKQGDVVVSSRNADIRPGNSLPARRNPRGHDDPQRRAQAGKGGQLVRSAGVAAQLMAKDGDYAQVKLPSGEIRKIHIDCRATIGQVSNTEHQNMSLGKAGRTRWLGRRPHNRGVTHEPRRSPDGRWRRPHQRRTSPVLAVGSARQGPQDAQQQAHRRDDRQAAEGEGLRWRAVSRKGRSSTATC